MALSFSAAAKAEICRNIPSKHCCALAECFGILLFCNSFGGEGIRIIPEGYPAMQMVMPVGGFLVLGFVIAGSQHLMRKLENRKKDKEAAK